MADNAPTRDEQRKAAEAQKAQKKATAKRKASREWKPPFDGAHRGY